MTSLRLSLVAALLFHCGRAIAAPPEVTCTFDDHGLATLRYGDVQFIKRGTPVIHHVWFSDDHGANVAADQSNPSISFDRITQRYSYALPWGAVRCRCQLAGHRLNIELTLENDTAGPMSGVELDLLELQFPPHPSGTPWEKRFQTISDNDGHITAQVADYHTGVLTFYQDDPASAIRAGFSPGAPPPQETWQLRITTAGSIGSPPSVLVKPRGTRTFHFSIRFTEPGVPPK